MTRWLITPVAALLVALALFLLMEWLIRPPQGPDDLMRVLPEVEVVRTTPDEEPPPDFASPDAAPPPPPAAPPALAQPDLPSITVPALTAVPMNLGPVALPTRLAGNSLKLGSSGAFGGFAGGGGGLGTGKGFSGRPLIPLSTARPQMPEWACKQKIRGWVEVVFTVLPTGKVANVRLIDADPRGVFETAAIESVANWIYESHERAREVKQRVEMDPADCAYNWQ